MDSKSIILYHSGAGSTKTIAEIYYKLLITAYNITLKSVDEITSYNELERYDTIILGFPTYHCEPSRSMQDFVEAMPVMKLKKRSFVFTTFALYPGNSIRQLITQLTRKNVECHGYTGYRAPATDGALLLPRLTFLLNYQANVDRRISDDLEAIKSIIHGRTAKALKPRLKWYSILNYPNKLIGKAYKHKITIDHQLCTCCSLCINQCIRRCLQVGKTGKPVHSETNCESCFRCIHHCPTEAMMLSSKTRFRKKLNPGFYRETKDNILHTLETKR